MNTISNLRDELRGRRQARAQRRTLERELATYNTEADVHDLLGSLQGQDDDATEAIRDIIMRNHLRHGLHRAS